LSPVALGQVGGDGGFLANTVRQGEGCWKNRLPEDACNSYRTLYQELQALEAEQLTQLRLEQHVLMPRFAEALSGPDHAPAVLDAINLRREPDAALLRGDAQRLLGRHLEAEAAFDAAAETLES